MKTFLALLLARNKEFYRDRASISWAVILPVIIIMAVSVAFSGRDQQLFKIGLLAQASTQNVARVVLSDALQKNYIEVVTIQDQEKALTRVRHHQFDLLLQQTESGWRYWINDNAAKGEVLQALLLVSAPQAHKETVSGRAVRYIDWAMPGVLGMNIMFGALFGVGYVIVRYRKMGVLKRLQATPVTAFQFLSAQLISRLLIITVVSGMIFVGCDIFLDFLMLGSYFLLFIIALLGGFSMIALGLIVSSRTDNEELAGGLLNVASYPMLLLSEVWFSLDGAPQWMKTAAQVLPMTHMLDAARAVMLEGAGWRDVSVHLLVMAVMSVVFLSIAAVMFRWGKN
ncbi:MAG TPA: ABC transporter permease [Pseudomonadales bacterium]|nr:ABC transporter permease [Pseudomonadales bacterium]